MSKMVSRNTVTFQSGGETPLGRVLLAGEWENGRGITPRRPLRVYGSFAAVGITKGEGMYEDANGARATVAAGDVILVFPELAHWYGPRRGAFWDEFYVTFDGPLFDLWRTSGLLSPRRPVLRFGDCASLIQWREDLRPLLNSLTLPLKTGERTRQMARFGEWLNRPLLLPPDAPETEAEPSEPLWLSRARSLLDTELSRDLSPRSIAEAVGLSYETFRKRFGQALGVSPARYRTARRIEAACALLAYTPQITNKQAAASLGFADEYHFSRRFKEMTGRTPREFRRGGAP